MSYFFSYCHFFAATIYAILGVAIIARDYRSKLNQACASIFACFFIWSFSFVWIHHPETSKATAAMADKIGAFGWISFASFHLWFAWLYTRRHPSKYFSFYATTRSALERSADSCLLSSSMNR